MSLTYSQYLEIMSLPDWTIWNDPDTHNLENSNGDYYYTENLYAKTPDGIIYVPEKEIVNGASIPWCAQWLIPKSGKWNRPSGFHDSGYNHGGFYMAILGFNDRIIDNVFIQRTQKEVDYTYLKLMEFRNVKEWKRKTQYRTLRMFGSFTWNKYRKQDNKRIHKNLLNKMDKKIKG